MCNLTKLNKFITKAKKIHGDKYDYSLCEYINSNVKVKIVCNKHGVFEQLMVKHINRKQGCSLCNGGVKLTTNEFITRAKKIHGDKYDYSLCEYINSKIKVKIICDKHGVFEQIASSHTDQKTGCPICSKKHNYNNSEFIEKAIIIHNNIYDYSDIEYKNNYTKIKIKCNKHGVFEQTPTNHLNGKGCPICKDSKGEREIRQYLNQNNINFIYQHTFSDCRNIKLLPFDFYLPNYNICIEFNGEQHYKPIKWFGGEKTLEGIKKRDKIKMEYCQNNNIPLIIINNDNYDLQKKLSLFI
jgi:hypothetical protein